EWMRGLIAEVVPRRVILMGFSSAGDFVLRMAGADSDPPLQLDGCLSLGCNLALETCFLTRVLSTVKGESEAELLQTLHSISTATNDLDGWLNIHEYLLSVTRRFRDSWEPLRVFARDIVSAFEEAPLEPFIQWYRAATARGRRLRCVFEDAAPYDTLVR